MQTLQSRIKLLIIGMGVLVVLTVAVLLSPFGNRFLSKIPKSALLTATFSPSPQSTSQPPVTSSDLSTSTSPAEFKELPDGFPQDFPVFEGALVDSAAQTGEGSSVVWTTGADFTKVVDFYKKAFADGGWNIESSATVERGTLFNLNKGNIKATVIIARNLERSQTLIFATIPSK